MSSITPFPLDQRETVQGFLSQHKAMSLATVNDRSEVANAPLYYAQTDFLVLYFTSDPASLHSQNILSSPEVAGAVYREGDKISEIEGLQFKGLCEKLEEDKMAREVYLECFPELKEHPKMMEKFKTSVMYQIKVTWLRWISMQAGRPFRVEGLL